MFHDVPWFSLMFIALPSTTVNPRQPHPPAARTQGRRRAVFFLARESRVLGRPRQALDGTFSWRNPKEIAQNQPTNHGHHGKSVVFSRSEMIYKCWMFHIFLCYFAVGWITNYIPVVCPTKLLKITVHAMYSFVCVRHNHRCWCSWIIKFIHLDIHHHPSPMWSASTPRLVTEHEIKTVCTRRFPMPMPHHPCGRPDP